VTGGMGGGWTLLLKRACWVVAHRIGRFDVAAKNLSVS
jgi:hypothetical protein